jgi:hypothetical protein
MKIHVISTGYNCAEYVQGCYESVKNQVCEVQFYHWMMDLHIRLTTLK